MEAFLSQQRKMPPLVMAGIPLRSAPDGSVVPDPGEVPDIRRIEETHVEWLAYWRLPERGQAAIDVAYDALPTALKLEEMVFGVQMEDK